MAFMNQRAMTNEGARNKSPQTDLQLETEEAAKSFQDTCVNL